MIKVEEFAHINGWDSTFEVMGSRSSSRVSTPISEQSEVKIVVEEATKVFTSSLWGYSTGKMLHERF